MHVRRSEPRHVDPLVRHQGHVENNDASFFLGCDALPIHHHTFLRLPAISSPPRFTVFWKPRQIPQTVKSKQLQRWMRRSLIRPLRRSPRRPRDFRWYISICAAEACIRGVNTDWRAQMYQTYLDKSTPFITYRWAGTAAVFVLFALRIVLAQGWYIGRLNRGREGD